MSEIVPTVCRLCIAHCGVLATVEDDDGRRKVTRVTGDPDNPVFEGYTCPKGRALPELHNHEGRLLRAMKRQPGTIVVEILPPIEPGLKRRDFMARLEGAIEPATQKLVEEAQQTLSYRD